MYTLTQIHTNAIETRNGEKENSLKIRLPLATDRTSYFICLSCRSIFMFGWEACDFSIRFVWTRWRHDSLTRLGVLVRPKAALLTYNCCCCSMRWEKEKKWKRNCVTAKKKSSMKRMFIMFHNSFLLFSLTLAPSFSCSFALFSSLLLWFRVRNILGWHNSKGLTAKKTRWRKRMSWTTTEKYRFSNTFYIKLALLNIINDYNLENVICISHSPLAESTLPGPSAWYLFYTCVYVPCTVYME